MITPNDLYAGLKFWLPMITGFSLVIKAYFSAKKNTTEWAGKLLDNHLAHIQDATQSTANSVGKLGSLITDHQDKEMQVWAGVVNSLAVLSDRTTSIRRKASRSRKKK